MARTPSRGRRALALALLALLAAAADAAAGQPAPRTRVVPWTGQPVVIGVAAGRTTAISLPAPVATVVTNATKDALSLETVGNRLYVTPLDERWSGEVFAVLSDGSEVPLVLAPAAAEPDFVVRLVRARPPDGAAGGAAPGWSPLRLMRAMMLGERAQGVSVSADAGRTVVYDDSVLTLRVLERWRTPTFEGVVLEAENRTELWIRLALESLDFPGLLAVSADDDSLAPRPATPEARLAGRHRTRVYLVRLPEVSR